MTWTEYRRIVDAAHDEFAAAQRAATAEYNAAVGYVFGQPTPASMGYDSPELRKCNAVTDAAHAVRNEIVEAAAKEYHAQPVDDPAYCVPA